ncbi:MAG: DUF1059 domain-containing protein [Acidobacteria bacterium]|nr:DUF1059 domain-containing protein [Acidobacteriota bacterium]
MATQIRCAELMPGCRCTFVLIGENVDELIAVATGHAVSDHGMPAIPPAMIAKLRGLTEDRDPSKCLPRQRSA